jgi:hypothetical protein
MGLCPAAMGFSDGPTEPLVYNFGYRGAHPLGMWFQLMRVLDAGVKPDFVMIHMAYYEIRGREIPGETLMRPWAPRMSAADLRRIAPYVQSSEELWQEWAERRLIAWRGSGEAIFSDRLPNWQIEHRQYGDSKMDKYGFDPNPYESFTPQMREAERRKTLEKHGPRLKVGAPPYSLTQRVYRDLIERCHAEGIAVAFCWVPESPRYRAAYSADAKKAIADYTHVLTGTFGLPVFPAPENLGEEDFLDGYHLFRHGAERYSRWLADTHLKPWLVRQGVAR